MVGKALDFMDQATKHWGQHDSECADQISDAIEAC